MYNFSNFRTRGAIVRSGEHHVYRLIVANELAHSLVLLDFKQDMHLLLETSCHYRTRIGDDMIKVSPTHNDWYGFLTSHHEVLPGAAESMKSRSPLITTEVVLTNEYRFAVPMPDPTIASNYQVIPDDWIIVDDKNSVERIKQWFDASQNDTSDRYELSPIRGGMRGKDDQIIWSSENTPEENLFLFEGFLAQLLGLGHITQQKFQSERSQYLDYVHSLFRPQDA